MQLNDNDKEYAEFQFKARIVGGFIFCTLFSVIFLVIIIVLAAQGKGNLAIYFIAPLIVSAIVAVITGVFMYMRRDKKLKNKKEDENKENNK